eukprot:6182262-Pleurochrysis_carterae.AAC.1
MEGTQSMSAKLKTWMHIAKLDFHGIYKTFFGGAALVVFICDCAHMLSTVVSSAMIQYLVAHVGFVDYHLHRQRRGFHTNFGILSAEPKLIDKYL